MIYKKKPVIIVNDNDGAHFLQITFDEPHNAFWVRRSDLTEAKPRKLSTVEQALSIDPEVLEALVPLVRRIEISSSPDAVSRCASAISENSDLTEYDAIDYIKIVSDKSHADKFDVLIDAAIGEDLRQRASVFFNEKGWRARDNELQVGSKALALWLMKNHNIKPTKAV